MVVKPPRAPDWATNRKGTCRSTSATFSAWLSSITCRVTTITDADVADTGVACPVTVMTVGSACGTDWAHGSAGASIAIARILKVRRVTTVLRQLKALKMAPIPNHDIVSKKGGTEDI